MYLTFFIFSIFNCMGTCPEKLLSPTKQSKPQLPIPINRGLRKTSVSHFLFSPLPEAFLALS